MIDTLRASVFVGAAAIAFSMACFTYVAVSNSRSRNISLALGAVFASLLALVLQMAFELQPTDPVVTLLATEFTIDNLKPKIMQFRYPAKSDIRFGLEEEANKFLVATNPNAFKGYPDKLWRDMSLLSVVLYVLSDQRDWQITREKIADANSARPYERIRFLSDVHDPNQCSMVTASRIREMLHRVDNLFADFKVDWWPLDYVCLPPRSTISIEPGGLAGC